MTGRQLRLVPAADVVPQPVRWLWPGLIPLGKVTVLAGAPGLGKSLLTTKVAALTSVGAAPGLLHTVGDVLLVNAEDDPADTIKPRLLAAGADCDRVHLVDVREVDEGVAYDGIVQLPGDVHALHAQVGATGARLVVLDPVAAFLDGDHSAYREQEVRAALAPLKAMAEDTGCAVVLVMHLNKADGADPLRRIGNSGAFTALARSVLLFGEDPEAEDDDVRRVLTVVKSNAGVGGGAGLVFEIQSRSVIADDGEVIPAPVLETVGTSRMSAEDLLGSREDRTRTGEAVRWLRDALAAGPLSADEVRKRAEAEGHAWRTVERAKPKVARSVKLGQSDGWVWTLRDEEDGDDGPPTTNGGLGGVGGLPMMPREGVGGLRSLDGGLPKTAKTANTATTDGDDGGDALFDALKAAFPGSVEEAW